MIKLVYEQVADSVMKEVLSSLLDQLNGIVLIKGQWQKIEFTVPAAATNYKIPHQLGFKPKDVIHLSSIGAGSVTFNNADFSRTHIDVTTTGAVTVRAFVGTHQEG